MSQVIANYESLSTLMGQMREAAGRGEWEQLIGIERQCGTLIASMKILDSNTPLDEATQQHKIQLINKILADDAEIRTLTQAWMDQLQGLMQSNHQERRLLKTYGV